MILFGAKDYLPKFTGAENVTGGYVTESDAKRIVREFIEDNPELIIKSVQKMQQKLYEEQMKKQQSLIKDNKASITSSSHPTLGNTGGDVTIVKFYDYRCGHCKHAHKNLQNIMKSDSNVKVVLRAVPMLGPDSEKAARASLAAYTIAPSKFEKFHEKLLNAHSYNDNNIKKLARESGYDPTVVMSKMKSEEVSKLLQESQQAARVIGLRGVPGFLIGEDLIPGNLPENEFKNRIASLRKQNK